MSKTWLILDCNYLCHRAKHSMGGLSYEGTVTGVIYGFLKSVIAFQEKFNTSNVVFCWDSKTNKRKEIYSKYKQNREDRFKDMSKSEVKFEWAFREQMKMLRKEYLRTIGYRNIFCQKGYEADDLIASVCAYLKENEKAIIITSDKDLYQCINHYVNFYNPQRNKMITYQSFVKDYGIEPCTYATVKAIAGCSTDNIPGVKGVGEKTAIKFLTSQLKKDQKTFWGDVVLY